MSRKIALISLGCAKNLVNSEQMLYLLDDAGYELVGNPAEAEAVVINTCGFIDSAKSEAIDHILEMGQLKAEGQLQKIIVTGCLSQRYKEEILADLPEVDAVVGMGGYDAIVTVIERCFEGEQVVFMGDKHGPVEETARIISTGPAWAYLKIAEGCDNCCNYCAIPSIRGRFRSRSMENILEEARELAEAGIKEIIVVAQDITRYGTDLYGKRMLGELTREIAKIEGVHWIRLHYLYPDEFDDDLIEVIATEPKVVKYLDIPIQHINDTVLKKMNRRGTGDEIRVLFKKLRERIPGLVLRTSLIVGHPGEDEAAYEELCDFLREVRIERAGVFPYSPEEGTPSAKMPDRCDEDEAQRRAELIMDMQATIMDDYNEAMTGHVVEVLCEGYDAESECWHGRTYADSPDIDGQVYFTGNGEPGTFCEVEILGAVDGELTGEAI